MAGIVINASSVKQKTFDSINSELEAIEKKINSAASKGELEVIVDKPSAAARLFFKDRGFKVKINLETGVEVGTSHKWVIGWE